jgi:hypothetical protein
MSRGFVEVGRGKGGMAVAAPGLRLGAVPSLPDPPDEDEPLAAAGTLG